MKDFSAWIALAAKQASGGQTAAADGHDGQAANDQAADQTEEGRLEVQSSGSSIKKLQRILEIEEMRQFSEQLDRVMTARWLKGHAILILCDRAKDKGEASPEVIEKREKWGFQEVFEQRVKASHEVIDNNKSWPFNEVIGKKKFHDILLGLSEFDQLFSALILELLFFLIKEMSSLTMLW